MRLGLRGLGAATTLTPDEAFALAIQQTGFGPRNPKDFANQAWLSRMYSMIQNGQFDSTLVSTTCAGSPNVAKNLTLTQAAGSIAGMGTSIAASAASAIGSGAVGAALGAASLGIGAVVAVLSIIFAHHAAAVKQEQNILCTATSGANNALSAIAQGVQSGQIAPATAAQSLDSLYSQYAALVQPSFGTHPWCNANCEMQIVMKAICLYWQAQYQAMADQQVAAASNPAGSAVATVQSAIASTGLPSWIVWALGGFLVYEFIH